MAAPDDLTVQVASAAFLASMRREQARRFPDSEIVRAPRLEDLRPADRVSLMRAIKVALIAAAPENVERVLRQSDSSHPTS